MIYEFFYEDRVDDDINEALDYFFEIKPILAAQFLKRIDEAKQRIMNAPKGFVEKHSEVRTILLKQFDYHIYYILEVNKIIIVAILHAQSGEEKISKI